MCNHIFVRVNSQLSSNHTKDLFEACVYMNMCIFLPFSSHTPTHSGGTRFWHRRRVALRQANWHIRLDLACNKYVCECVWMSACACASGRVYSRQNLGRGNLTVRFCHISLLCFRTWDRADAFRYDKKAPRYCEVTEHTKPPRPT